MSRTLLIGGFAVVALAAAAGVATAQQPTPQAPAAGAPVSRAQFVEHRVQRLVAADANGDGTVTRDERRARMQVARQERAEARFTRLDTDGDGRLSREEFLSRAEKAAHGPRAERVRREHGPRAGHGERGPVEIADVRARAEQAFARLDTDSDGFLSADERRAGREAMREHRGRRMGEGRAMREASPPAPASE